VVCTDPASFDLVLMDINMPVMDGHEATTTLRAAGIKVPIVAMTAHALKGHIELCLERGMDDYVPKYVTVCIARGGANFHVGVVCLLTRLAGPWTEIDLLPLC